MYERVQLIKNTNNNLDEVYPKTSADIVQYDSETTLYDKLNQLQMLIHGLAVKEGNRVLSTNDFTDDDLEAVLDDSRRNINIGELMYLETNNKDTLVNAINELYDMLENVNTKAKELISKKFFGSTLLDNLNEELYFNNNSIRDWALAFTNIKNIVIPENITSINEGAFYSCSTLTKAEFKNTLNIIGNRAFAGCTELAKIDTEADDKPTNCKDGMMWLSDSINVIGNEAFKDCNKIQYLKLSSGINVLDNGAFKNCTGLKGIVYNNDTEIGINLETINSEAFYNCTNLVSFVPVEFTEWNRPGQPLTEDSAKEYIMQDPLDSKIIIPSTVTEIGNGVFYNCTSITNAEIPNSVIKIGKKKKKKCSSLAVVILPNKITTIEEDLFNECTSLENVSLPSSIENINSRAFANCTSLTSINIESLTPPNLGDDVFAQHNNNLKIYVPYSEESIILNAYKTADKWSAYADIIYEAEQSTTNNG